jgi:hypothetical protein
MGRLYYFAYGSNLHPERLRTRAPSARALGRARLRGYRLQFHKRGRDSSAKCDAWRTGRRTDLVYGVVFSVARSDRRVLDAAEDIGCGYDRKLVSVTLGVRRRIVFSYLTRPEAIDANLRPLEWYLGFVLRGARHHGLPGRYLSRIAREDATQDPERTRHRRNRRVLLTGAKPHRRR